MRLPWPSTRVRRLPFRPNGSSGTCCRCLSDVDVQLFLSGTASLLSSASSKEEAPYREKCVGNPQVVLDMRHSEEFGRVMVTEVSVGQPWVQPLFTERQLHAVFLKVATSDGSLHIWCVLHSPCWPRRSSTASLSWCSPSLILDRLDLQIHIDIWYCWRKLSKRPSSGD